MRAGKHTASEKVLKELIDDGHLHGNLCCNLFHNLATSIGLQGNRQDEALAYQRKAIAVGKASEDQDKGVLVASYLQLTRMLLDNNHYSVLSTNTDLTLLGNVIVEISLACKEVLKIDPNNTEAGAYLRKVRGLSAARNELLKKQNSSESQSM